MSVALPCCHLKNSCSLYARMQQSKRQCRAPRQSRHSSCHDAVGTNLHHPHNLQSVMSAWRAGAAAAVLGTNPICVSVPAEGAPVTLDMATSAYPWYSVVADAAAGRELPEGAPAAHACGSGCGLVGLRGACKAVQAILGQRTLGLAGSTAT
jgi:Malate/L-lactate dehydrogenase